jgi:hypothetical protein
LSKIPDTLLGNVYESFAVLVDSRLRAYSSFLAREGVTALAKKNPSVVPADLGALEQKIKALLAVGRKVSIHSVSTYFEESQLMEYEERDSRVSFALQFQVHMNLIVPRTSGETERVSVSLSAPGQITGKSYRLLLFNADLTSP